MKTEGLLLAALGVTVTYAWMSRRERKPKANSTTASPPSPFVAGSSCTEIAEPVAIERWLTTKVAPMVGPRLDAFAVPLHQHEAAREAIVRLVDEVFAATVPECPVVQTAAAQQVWKWLWCDVVAQLVVRDKLDEELDDVLGLCVDPGFDPRAPKESPVESSKPPPKPRPWPMPPIPMPSVGRAKGARPVRRIVRPRRFGDLLRAMAAEYRASLARAVRRPVKPRAMSGRSASGRSTSQRSASQCSTSRYPANRRPANPLRRRGG